MIALTLNVGSCDLYSGHLNILFSLARSSVSNYRSRVIVLFDCFPSFRSVAVRKCAYCMRTAGSTMSRQKVCRCDWNGQIIGMCMIFCRVRQQNCRFNLIDPYDNAFFLFTASLEVLSFINMQRYKIFASSTLSHVNDLLKAVIIHPG